MDELKIQLHKKYTRREKKDGNGELAHFFYAFLKETYETEEARVCLRHCIRQLEEGEGGTSGNARIEFCSPGERICLARIGRRKEVGKQNNAENVEC